MQREQTTAPELNEKHFETDEAVRTSIIEWVDKKQEELLDGFFFNTDLSDCLDISIGSLTDLMELDEDGFLDHETVIERINAATSPISLLMRLEQLHNQKKTQRSVMETHLLKKKIARLEEEKAEAERRAKARRTPRK